VGGEPPMLLLASYDWIIFPSPTKPFEFLLRRGSNGWSRSRWNLKSPARCLSSLKILCQPRSRFTTIHPIKAELKALRNTGATAWLLTHSCQSYELGSTRFPPCGQRQSLALHKHRIRGQPGALMLFEVLTASRRNDKLRIAGAGVY
jgi:hypothetical protein